MQILAKGSSMFPTLLDGHLYEAELVNEENIQTGDIIVFYADHRVICHRVIRVYTLRNQRVFFKTQGDHCLKPDPYAVTGDMVIGRIRQSCETHIENTTGRRVAYE